MRKRSSFYNLVLTKINNSISGSGYYLRDTAVATSTFFSSFVGLITIMTTIKAITKKNKAKIEIVFMHTHTLLLHIYFVPFIISISKK